MKTKVEVLLTPAEWAGLSHESQSLGSATCVVFDVLRATSSMVTALHEGAREVVVVSEIAEALARHAASPEILLAGERGGRRIQAAVTGSIDFHLGNSPREFTPARVTGKTIVMTTTNGTRALRACEDAPMVLAGSMLNLTATADALCRGVAPLLILVCAGTGDGPSYEDVLGAGALLSLLPDAAFDRSGDSCSMAIHLHKRVANDLKRAFAETLNGRRLAADPELAGDLEYCAQHDVFPCPVLVSGQTARLMETT